MKIVLSQYADAETTMKMYVDTETRKEKRNAPKIELRFVGAQVQRIIMSLANRYATKIRLADATSGYPHYATMVVSLTVPAQLVTLLKELDNNQDLLTKTTSEEVNRLTKGVTIKSVRGFLAVQRLLTEKPQKTA